MATAIAKQAPPTAGEALHFAAKCDTMAAGCEKYGAAYQCFTSAAHSLRSAVGHLMKEEQDRKEKALAVESEVLAD